MLIIGTDGDHGRELVVRGLIAGPDLDRFGEALEQASRTPGRTLRVDVSGVEDWSLLAQAMLLSTARRMAGRGGRLVLYGPSEELRRASARLDVFSRVTTHYPAAAHAAPPRGPR